jgi:phosphopantothenoylcysteine decarboxylase/phosphopantothenate--cysteine ligase
MYDACHNHFASVDVVIVAAPWPITGQKVIADQKNKNRGEFSIELERQKTFTLGKSKESIPDWFALETEMKLRMQSSKSRRKI